MLRLSHRLLLHNNVLLLTRIFLLLIDIFTVVFLHFYLLFGILFLLMSLINWLLDSRVDISSNLSGRIAGLDILLFFNYVCYFLDRVFCGSLRLDHLVAFVRGVALRGLLHLLRSVLVVVQS